MEVGIDDRFADERQPAETDTPKCYGCGATSVTLLECSFCKKLFGVECECLTRDFKETDLDLCDLECQGKTDHIIAHMVEQLDIEQRSCKIYRDGYNKLQNAIKTCASL